MLKSDLARTKNLADQFKVNLIQGITQTMGESTIKFTVAEVTVTNLQPTGTQLSIKYVAEVYPK